MAEKLTGDLNIIQSSNIEITVDPITADLNIIQKLDDEPNDVGGLSAAELKAKFDEAGNIIKAYINDSLVPQVLSEGITEAQRQENETARQTAETARRAAESARASAETARQSAEAARETAQEAFFQGVSAQAVTLEPGTDATAQASPAGKSFRVTFGIPRGETGPRGERGINGVAVAAAGTYAFNVDENGHLILHYTGDDAPDFSINASGHLILTV